MKVAFCVQNFTYRGTEVALFDYALYNRKILNNISVIVYPYNIDMSNTNVVRKFSENFYMICYKNMDELDQLCQDHNIDCVYTIKYGRFDNLVLKTIPTFVHCVFEMLNPHGSVYAGVSPSVANKKYPFVPHIVSLPKSSGDYRESLGIPLDATVFGRHGGIDTFNIPYARTAIIEILNKRHDVYFLFCVRPTLLNDVNHPRLLSFESFVDKRIKRKFIDTCDAMIHASSLGESFGLSVLEFSFCNKPVITCNNGQWHKQHLDYLGESALRYNNQSELSKLLTDFNKTDYANKNWNVTSQFSPDNVMEKFNSVFIQTLKN